MCAAAELDVYWTAVREEVCTRCIERVPGAPPCEPHGKGCGLERHLPKLVEICHSTESVQMAPYLDRLHDEICQDCALRTTPQCPCPLSYLLELAVEAIEAVDRWQGRPPSEGASGGSSTP